MIISLTYVDDDGEKNVVEDSRDLIQAYKYSEMTSDNNNVLKFIVDVIRNKAALIKPVEEVPSQAY